MKLRFALSVSTSCGLTAGPGDPVSIMDPAVKPQDVDTEKKFAQLQNIKLKPSITSCLLFLLLFVTLINKIYAIDLMEVYQQALDSDPTFKSAYQRYQAQAELIPQAESFLLPQVTFSGLAGRNYEYIKTELTLTQQTYNGNAWQIKASQALFNFEAWSKVQQAKASVKAAFASFNDAEQELMLRVATAYLKVLYAQDVLHFCKERKRSFKRQLVETKKQFHAGLRNISSVYQASSNYRESVSQKIKAENYLQQQRELLGVLTNRVYDNLAPLRNKEIPLISPSPAKIEEWVRVSVGQNYLLQATKYLTEVARENIRSKSNSRWPVIQIQGQTATTHADNTHKPSAAASDASIAERIDTAENNILQNFMVPTKQIDSSIGIAMNLPLYQGGLVVSQIKQAQYEFQAANLAFEKTYREIVANTRIAYNDITFGIKKIKSSRKGLSVRIKSLNSLIAQYNTGLLTTMEISWAEQNLYAAQKQLANDQYALIIATLTLKYLAGSLNVGDLEEINSWLRTSRARNLPQKPTRRS